ncbi:MAG: MFS transporter [Bacteroidales bacterium]|nr:MFS transporter [Bacteroidales bacterium]
MEKKQNYTIPIIVMILLFGMISFVTNLASPMGDILEHQFSIPNWQSTLGVFANFIAYALMGIPAGNLLQKRGYKTTALIAVAVGFTGVAIQFVSGLVGSFGVYLLGALVAGFSMCLLNTVVNPMLNRLGGGGNKGNQLIQFGGTFNSLCGTSVIVITGLLIPSIVDARISDTFPLMYTAMAIFALAFIVILLTKIPENPESSEKSGDTLPLKGLLDYRHFILGAIAIFIYVGVEVGTPQMLNQWLQDAKLDILSSTTNDEAIAASVTGFYWLLMLVGRLIGGVLGAKVSARRMLAVAATAAVVLVSLAIFIPATVQIQFLGFNGANGFGFNLIPLSAALLVCVGLCTSVMWGGIFNLAVEGLGKYTERASGLFMALVCGGGILPLLMNGVVDIFGTSGYMPSYWIVVAGFAYILFYALVGSKPKTVK